MLRRAQAGIQFPYVEGLRLDEAMHPLALLTVGMYGETLPQPERRARAAGGAVEIRLQEHQVDRADSLHGEAAAHHLEPKRPAAYGFYSNVNPNRDHPNWSQKEEQRLGEGSLFSAKIIKTQMFNGYGEPGFQACTRAWISTATTDLRSLLKELPLDMETVDPCSSGNLPTSTIPRSHPRKCTEPPDVFWRGRRHPGRLGAYRRCRSPPPRSMA